MSLLSKLSTTLLGAVVATGFATSAFATPAPTTAEVQRHYDLLEVVAQTGVSVFVNHPQCNEQRGIAGFYSSSHNILVICQDNRDPFVSGQLVDWTANDLDTIRHETQHLVQDCEAGFHNSEMLNSFPMSRLPEFVTSSLTQQQIGWIIDTYTRNGADEEVIKLELEAFSVATTQTPENIGVMVSAVCSNSL